MMKTHKFDGISFFTGLVFAAIGLLYLIPRDVSDIIDLFINAGTWFWPALFLAIGAAVLIPALRPRRTESEEMSNSLSDARPDRET